jgi:hypothetical protein
VKKGNMPIVGKHQLENNFFILPNLPKEEGNFQEFDEDIRNFESIHISMLAMDFRDGTSKKKRDDIENEWLEKLPTLDNVKHLSIRHRVNQAFFETICEMKNLESINFWSSTIEDLSPLKKLKKLYSLHLSRFTKLTDISPLIEIKSINRLSIEGCFKVKNYEDIGGMMQLIALCLDGDTFAPKNLMLKSLKPFTSLKNLKHLDLTTSSIKDKSFLELLKLESLVRLDAGWRMKKQIRNKIKQEHKHLKSGFFMVYDFDNHEFYKGTEWWLD